MPCFAPGHSLPLLAPKYWPYQVVQQWFQKDKFIINIM